jgi:glycosyltransferase involved in cell wall biosynthesis
MNGPLSSRRINAIGVTIPVHNEDQRLGRALESLNHAFAEFADSGVVLQVVIVLDACRDASEAVVREWRRGVEQRGEFRVDTLECAFENVGRARALGCDHLLRAFQGVPLSTIWLATSDADSRVPRRWLAAQINQYMKGADAWVGRVSVSDWHRQRRETALTWQREYESERRPIHGANLGFAANHYLAAGGFRAVTTGEDQAMVEALLVEGAAVHFDSVTRVSTSSRRQARAPEGFSTALRFIDARATGNVERSRIDPGCDETYVQQVGSDMDGFFDLYSSRVLPVLRSERSRDVGSQGVWRR